MRGREVVIRWLGLVAVGARRTLTRATGTSRLRVHVTVAGVAVAVALLVVVAGIGVGLATGTNLADDGVDYWIVPEDGGDRSSLVAPGGPQFGDVHGASAQIAANEEVDAVSPVLSAVLRVESDVGAEYVLVVGVIGSPGLNRVAGVETGALTPGDPFYGDGGYDGTWTGEVVLSESAASLLGVSRGDPVSVEGNDSFAVVGVADAGDAGDVPTAVVQLSELQTVTGAAAHDQADQFVVRSDSGAVRSDLEGVYPSSSVQTRHGLAVVSTLDAALPMALIVGALAVVVVVGALFVVTTTSLELLADRQQLAAMGALGLSTRSQLGLVGVQTLVTTVLGGVLGAVGGLALIVLLNEVATRTITTEPVATAHLAFVPLGVAAALVVGLASLPFLLVLTHRVSGGVPE